MADAAAAQTEQPKASVAPPISGARRYTQRDEERDTTPKPTIFVGNLFFDVAENDLEKEFTRFGRLKNVKIIRDSRGLSKG